MARRVPRDMTVEEFYDWSNAVTKFEEVGKAADEVGGPRLSLVPVPEQDIAWPTDLLPPDAADDADAGEAGTAEAPVPAMPFDGIPLESSRNRRAGWSAERQRVFLTALAETGQVHLAAATARLSVRSAQGLRVRSPAFNAAWRMAEQLGAGRLAPLAFDRAINGRVEQVYQDGTLVAERRVPNDKLLMWLLARLDPKRFALPWEQRGDADPQAQAADAFNGILDSLGDTPS
jgi:hypothetical protein